MGLLNRQDAKIMRGYFNEMCKLLGQSIGYQYITKRDMTIHSEDNNEYSMPIRLDVIFDENPSIDTLNKLGWVSELGEQQPIIVNMPYNTPNLTTGARLLLHSVEGIDRVRVFKVTKMESDLEYPDAYTCAIVPVFDQYPQKNQYTLVNHEKISQEESKRTSKDQSGAYITYTHDIDTTPEEHIKWEQEYSYINEDNSPYTGG